MFRERRNIRDTSFHQRGAAWNARERLLYRQLLRRAAAVLIADVCLASQESDDSYRECAIDQTGTPRPLLLAALCTVIQRSRLRRARTVSVPPVLRLNRTVDSFTDSECRDYFRFSKLDLRRLHRALRLPDQIRCQNRSKSPSEEALMILLRRLATPNRLGDLPVLFGREASQLSRVCNTLIDMIYQRHLSVLRDRLHRWVPDFEKFARCVRVKTTMGLGSIVGFVDGTFRPNCTPGGHDDIQRELFSGHKRRHGLKYQGTMLPNGIIADLYGPYSGRRNDAFLVTNSELNNRLAAAQAGRPVQYKIYGDAAYSITSHISRGYGGVNVTAAQREWNRQMSSARICVEWGFGKVVKQFAFIDHAADLKLFLQQIGKLYMVAVLCTNAHTCCYGSQTGEYFGVQAPTLEEYFSMSLEEQ